MKKHGVNHKLREELSPDRSSPYDRSASPTSSTSSRDTSRRHRRRSKSPYRHPRSVRPSWAEDSRRGHQAHKKHDAKSSYQPHTYESKAYQNRNLVDESTGKRSAPQIDHDHPSKKLKTGGETANVKSTVDDGRFVNRGKPRVPQDVSANGQAKITEVAVDIDQQTFTTGSAQSVSENHVLSNRKTEIPRVSNGKAQASDNRPDASDASTEAPATEEASAEERRRRREAIRARFKNQPDELRIRALQNTPTTNSSADPIKETHETAVKPADTSALNSPTATNVDTIQSESSPSSPNSPDAVGSPEPVTVTNDTDLVNQTRGASESAGTDEPSAADYDPTEDMREDRLRHDKRLGDESISAREHDDKREEEHQLPVPESGVSKPSQVEEAPAKSTADDMFASDDDDDMFAAEPTKVNTKSKPQQSEYPAKGKEIDTSMLDNWDDADGYYRPILGETIDGRYQVQSNLGKGMFSGVVRALDSYSGQMKAIKIIRNNESMVKAAQKEMAILKRLAELDPDDKKHVVRMERSFFHRDHLCLVFENLSLNLREVLKKFGRDVGINIKAIRSYAQQMFLALALMRKCNIYHADLKPDNILVTEDRASLKVCDLGSAGDGSEFDIAPYLVSRYYRAPEIILGCPYDFAIDTWSIGCTLFELFTGKILFTGRDNNGMLRSIMETRGKISVKMLKKAEFGALYFDDANLYFRSTERDKLTNREVVKLLNFQKPTRELKDRILAAAPKAMKEPERKELMLFTDLLDKCLMLNPERRITPSEALKHPFIHRGPTPIGPK